MKDLSPRQSEILHGLGVGLETKEIASSLRISPRTVEHHIREIKLRVGAASMRELVVYAVEERVRDELLAD